MWNVGPDGDIYFTGYFSDSIVHIPFTGLEDGVPTFGAPDNIAFPERFFDFRKVIRLAEDDAMIVAGATPELPGHPFDTRRQYHELAVYHDWSGDRRLVNRIEMPHPGYGGGETDRIVHAVVHAGDFLFAAWRHGVVHVYDLAHGNEVIRFIAGPKANGISGAFDDNNSAITAYRLGDEYVILAQSNENSRLLAYRWTPDTTPNETPDVAPSVQGRSDDSAAQLEWGGRTDTIGVIRGYHIYRQLANEREYRQIATLHAKARYRDEGLANGMAASYRVSAVNAAGEGPLSEAVSVVPVAASAELLAADNETGGE